MKRAPYCRAGCITIPSYETMLENSTVRDRFRTMRFRQIYAHTSSQIGLAIGSNLCAKSAMRAYIHQFGSPWYRFMNDFVYRHSQVTIFTGDEASRNTYLSNCNKIYGDANWQAAASLVDKWVHRDMNASLVEGLILQIHAELTGTMTGYRTSELRVRVPLTIRPSQSELHLCARKYAEWLAASMNTASLGPAAQYRFTHISPFRSHNRAVGAMIRYFVARRTRSPLPQYFARDDYIKAEYLAHHGCDCFYCELLG